MPLFLSVGPPPPPPPHPPPHIAECKPALVALAISFFFRFSAGKSHAERERERKREREMRVRIRVTFTGASLCFPHQYTRPSTSDSSSPASPTMAASMVEPYFRSSPELTGHQSVRLQFFCMPHPRSSLCLARVSLFARWLALSFPDLRL